jgi:peptide chain release factor 2
MRPPSRPTSGRERTALLFSGEHDERSAILTISAGAAGTEATDWAEMLLRMYLRWAERHRFATEIIDQQEGEQAGLKSVTVESRAGAPTAGCGPSAASRARADQPVRLPEAAPDDLRPRRGAARVDDDIEIELDWSQSGRHLPLAGRRRASTSTRPTAPCA